MESVIERLSPELLEMFLRTLFPEYQKQGEGIYLINQEGTKIILSDNGSSLEFKVVLNGVYSYSQIDEWNRSRRFSRCYSDSDRSTVFAFDCLTKNVHPTHLGQWLSLLKHLVKDLRTHFIQLEDASNSIYSQSVVRTLSINNFTEILDNFKGAPGIDIQDQGDMHYFVNFPLDPEDLQGPRHQAVIRLSKGVGKEFQWVDMQVGVKAEFNEETFKRMNIWNKKTRTSRIYFDSNIFILARSVGTGFGVTNYHIGRSIGEFVSVEAPEFIFFIIAGKAFLRSDLNEQV